MTEQAHAAAVLEQLRTSHRGTLVERLGIDFVEVTADRLVATMPVAGNTQPYGVLHGGASCALAETMGSVAAALHVGLARRVAGIEVSASHHRPAADGTVTGVCTPLHQGRTTASYQIEIRDAAGQRICTARLTCLLFDHEDEEPTRATTCADPSTPR